MWEHLLSSESGVALLSSCLKKNGHPLPIRPLSTTLLVSTEQISFKPADKLIDLALTAKK